VPRTLSLWEARKLCFECFEAAICGFSQLHSTESLPATDSKVHPGVAGVKVLGQVERLGATEGGSKELSGGVSGSNSWNRDREEDSDRS
jgi:hypothetical protein